VLPEFDPAQTGTAMFQVGCPRGMAGG
jgi:hypothetical protein